ncbi:Na+/H+ antiporter NhaA, partial [Micromonospora aurantiaca]|nr:Na+/H+ antiporter NhaA [Micromonospora aurantiaca]
AVIVLVRAAGIRQFGVYLILGVATWGALESSGVEPIVIGLAMGLLTYAHPAARTDLERATEVFRLFREQPTPEYARSAQTEVAAAISPNERLQLVIHPWTSYVIVPLFALANAGITISGGVLG